MLAGQVRKSDLCIILLGVVGFVFFCLFFKEAYPTASLNLQVSRDQSIKIAKRYLHQQGFSVAGYDETAIFLEEGPGVIYLQKTLGMGRFNALAKTVPLRFWRVRFFKELQHEEFFVEVDPVGVVVSFWHSIPEEAEGEDLKQSEALVLAEGFIRSQKGMDLSDYLLADTSTKKRENRTDHTFVWEASQQGLGDAVLRVKVGIHGKVVNVYDQFVKVPEKFIEEYEKERAKGGLLGSISRIFSLGLTLAAVAFFLMAYKKMDIPWKSALLLSVGMVASSLIEEVNAIPFVKSYYTTEAYLYAFFGETTLHAVESAFFLGTETFLLSIAGWAACRTAFQGREMVMGGTAGQGGLWIGFTKTALIGYMLAGMSLGYVTAFYLIGEKYLGVWSPLPSGYPNMFGTWLPFLEPFTHSFRAAVSEELMYRFFAIALLLKYTRSPFVAALIPAIIWGFAHSHYPVFPFYTRGIELTLEGLVYGYIFMRYGLIAVIVAHYAYDAIIIGMPLFQSSNPYFFGSGVSVAGVMMIPVAFGLAGMARDRFFVRTRKIPQEI